MRLTDSTLFAIAAFLTITAPGCGGDDDDANNSSTAGSSSTDPSSTGPGDGSTTNPDSETQGTSDDQTTDPSGGSDEGTSADTTTETGGETGGETGAETGEPQLLVGTMKQYLDEAISRGARANPNAVLVNIGGTGIQADGMIRLDTNGFVKRWHFGFDDADNDVSVDFIDSEDLDFPSVEFPAGNVVPTMEIPSPESLPDSDVVVAAFLEDCPNATLGGDTDSVSYTIDEDTMTVRAGVLTGAGDIWLSEVAGDGTLMEPTVICAE